MKSFRGRIISKLKSISIVSSLNPSFVFSSTIPKECDQRNGSLTELVDGSILVSEIFKDVQEEEDEELVPDHSHGTEKMGAAREVTEKMLESSSHEVQVENKGDAAVPAALLLTKNLKIEKISDCNPQSCLEQTAVEECKTKKCEKENQDFSLLQDFEEKCPPRGSESVVFYTTSFRGIRKTFEDCSAVRFLLESFGIVFDERDISMHLEYREELWQVMGSKVVPPRLFIRGRNIGGADEVVGLHEQGLLRKLLQGIPLIPSSRPCSGCGGVRFVLCLSCNGSRKITQDGHEFEGPVRCLACNENGLVKCPVCSLK